jgi:hypothetical protein
VAGLAHGAAAGDGRGHLRAGDADREQVIDKLKAAYVYGLVTKDELDARVSQTFAARTFAELAVITADIPAGLAPAPPTLRPAPARAGASATANVTQGDSAIMATAIFAGLALIAGVFSGPAAGLVVLGGLGSALMSLFMLASKIRSQHARQRGGQLPPRRGADSGLGAVHQAVSASPADRFDVGGPRRRGKADPVRRHRRSWQASVPSASACVAG